MSQVSDPILRTVNYSKIYDIPGGKVYAVDGVSVDVAAGEAVAVVGESGSGKSTLARGILHLEPATAGEIYFKGDEITQMSERQFRPLRRSIQMVFQDPRLSLNPRLSIRQTVAEPIRLHHVVARSEVDKRFRDVLDMVNLEPGLAGRRPHQLSGGQRQRVAIARAIATHPDFVVLDEPTSSLDMSVRAQIIDLLRRLQRELGMAYLFITHDLSTARALCSRTIVMYLGRVMEIGPSDEVFRSPKHPYTQALVSAIPIPDPKLKKKRIILRGETPSPTERIIGCPFATRCPYVRPDCTGHEIPLYDVGAGGQHRAACVLYGDQESRRRFEQETQAVVTAARNQQSAS